MFRGSQYTLKASIANFGISLVNAEVDTKDKFAQGEIQPTHGQIEHPKTRKTLKTQKTGILKILWVFEFSDLWPF